MFPGRSAARRSATASSARTSSATIRSATPISARPGKLLTPIRHGRLRDLKRSITAIGGVSVSARCARDAPTMCAMSPAWRTRPCSIAWPSA